MNTLDLEIASAFTAPYYAGKEDPDSQANPDGDSLEKAFITAMLLTGSVSMAEAAVLHAIGEQDNRAGSGPSLLCRTVSASLKTPSYMRLLSLQELESARNAVPANLRTVMLLPRLPRQCFVLSILLSLPRRECALLLKISAAEVGSYSGAAASVLAS